MYSFHTGELNMFGLFKKNYRGFSKFEALNDFYNSGKNIPEITIENAYELNSVVYRCVNELSSSASIIPIKYIQGEVEKNNDILKILERPSPTMSQREFFKSLYSYLCVYGEAYCQKIMLGNKVKELYLLDPRKMETVGRNVIPDYFKYTKDNGVEITFPVDKITGESEIKRFKLWHPKGHERALSPLNPIIAEVQEHSLITHHNKNIIENGGRQTGALIIDGGDDGLSLSDEQRSTLKEQIRSVFTGIKNAGKAILLEGPFKWVEMGVNPKDMDFMNCKNVSAREIASAYGIPPQIIGIPDSQTYNNYKEARLALYEDTIVPMTNNVIGDLNEWLLRDDAGYIFYDFNEIPAIAEKKIALREQTMKEIAGGLITRNEGRKSLDLDPVEGGDEILVAGNVFPLSTIASDEDNNEPPNNDDDDNDDDE